MQSTLWKTETVFTTIRQHENFERIHKREDYVTLLFPYMNMDASEQLQLYSVSFQSLFKKRREIFKKKGI